MAVPTLFNLSSYFSCVTRWWNNPFGFSAPGIRRRINSKSDYYRMATNIVQKWLNDNQQIKHTICLYIFHFHHFETLTHSLLLLLLFGVTKLIEHFPIASFVALSFTYVHNCFRTMVGKVDWLKCSNIFNSYNCASYKMFHLKSNLVPCP